MDALKEIMTHLNKEIALRQERKKKNYFCKMSNENHIKLIHIKIKTCLHKKVIQTTLLRKFNTFG